MAAQGATYKKFNKTLDETEEDIEMTEMSSR